MSKWPNGGVALLRKQGSFRLLAPQRYTTFPKRTCVRKARMVLVLLEFARVRKNLSNPRFNFFKSSPGFKVCGGKTL